MSGKKVLQIDNRDYYGGESASLNLTQILKSSRKQSRMMIPWEVIISTAWIRFSSF